MSEQIRGLLRPCKILGGFMIDPISIFVISSIVGAVSGAVAAGDEPKKSVRYAKSVTGGLGAAAATSALLNAANAAQQNQQASNPTSSSLPPSLSNLPNSLGNFNNLGGGGFGGGGC
jgi:hypothetical protein